MAAIVNEDDLQASFGEVEIRQSVAGGADFDGNDQFDGLSFNLRRRRPKPQQHARSAQGALSNGSHSLESS